MNRRFGDRNQPGKEDGKHGKLTMAIMGDKIKKPEEDATPALKSAVTIKSPKVVSPPTE